MIWILLGVWLVPAAFIAVLVRSIPGAGADSTVYAIFSGLLWPLALADVIIGGIRRRY
jgi:hypothetical protein